jgi:hypothetical protein
MILALYFGTARGMTKAKPIQWHKGTRCCVAVDSKGLWLPSGAEAQSRRFEQAIFHPQEIVAFLDDLQSGQVPDPVKILNGRDPNDPDDSELDEFQVLHDAEKILLSENAKRLLLSSDYH